MLTLIAESKTMTQCDTPISADTYAAHCPTLETYADNIMASLGDMSAAELTTAVKISQTMARRLVEMVYDFGNKTSGAAAIEAFTGVVFRALSYKTLDSCAQRHICGNVRIISSLYGWLRPDDIVKAYRLDFSTPLAPPDNKTFKSYWRPYVTGCLLRYIEKNACQEVLDLLPAEAAQCIDWRQVRQKASVYKVEFRELTDGSHTRTPNAGRLKTLRGELLRQIATEGITTANGLLNLTGQNYISEAEPSPSGTIIFTTTD